MEGKTYWCSDPQCSRYGMIGNRQRDGHPNGACGGRKVSIPFSARASLKRDIGRQIKNLYASRRYRSDDEKALFSIQIELLKQFRRSIK
jgi:hypothetical protein